MEEERPERLRHLFQRRSNPSPSLNQQQAATTTMIPPQPQTTTTTMTTPKPNQRQDTQEQCQVMKKVLSILNKVSSVNYSRLRKRWLSLMPKEDNEEESDCDEDSSHLSLSQIPSVLHLLIDKAMEDTIYMHIYAGLMGYVVSRKPPGIAARIRQLINSHLHQELERLTTDKELALFHRSTHRVDATRRRKVALHRFIAELYCEKACGSRFLFERVTDLLVNRGADVIDENVECLCVLMTFAGQKIEVEESRKKKASSWVPSIFRHLEQRQKETPSMISKRIQFMVLDLVEMRSNGWSPHNKWWSPSVQRGQGQEGEGLEEEAERSQEEPPSKVSKNDSKRLRTRSEGSNRNEVNVYVPPSLRRLQQATTTKSVQKQIPVQEEQQTTTKNNKKSRALMALLNKVSPLNVERIAQQLYQVLSSSTTMGEEEEGETTNFIVDKILDDSYYTRTHAALIFKVNSLGDGEDGNVVKGFGGRICARIMELLEKNPASKEGFQLLAELYLLNMVQVQQVCQALEWLKTVPPSSSINTAMESLVIFLFIAGAKLDADLKQEDQSLMNNKLDDCWLNGLIDFWEKKVSGDNKNQQGRPLCLLRDVIELRQNKWAPQRQPHWIPPTIDLPTVRFEPESLIRLFQSDRTEFLRFITSSFSSLPRIEKFCKEALKYAVRFGNCERDPDEFLKMTGLCLRVLLQQRLLRRDQLQGFLGTFVSEVVQMERVNKNAWNNFGRIMREVY